MKLYSVQGGSYMGLPLNYIVSARPMYSSLPHMSDGDEFWLTELTRIGPRGIMMESGKYFCMAPCMDPCPDKSHIDMFGVAFTNRDKNVFIEVYTEDFLNRHLPYKGKYIAKNGKLEVHNTGEWIDVNAGYWYDSLYFQPTFEELDRHLKFGKKFNTVSPPSNKCQECGLMCPHIDPVPGFVCRPCRMLKDAWS